MSYDPSHRKPPRQERWPNATPPEGWPSYRDGDAYRDGEQADSRYGADRRGAYPATAGHRSQVGYQRASGEPGDRGYRSAVATDTFPPARNGYGSADGYRVADGYGVAGGYGVADGYGDGGDDFDSGSVGSGGSHHGYRDPGNGYADPGSDYAGGINGYTGAANDLAGTTGGYGSSKNGYTGTIDGYPAAAEDFPGATYGFDGTTSGYHRAEGGYGRAEDGYGRAEDGYHRAEAGYHRAEGGYGRATDEYLGDTNGYDWNEHDYERPADGFADLADGFAGYPGQGSYAEPASTDPRLTAPDVGVRPSSWQADQDRRREASQRGPLVGAVTVFLAAAVALGVSTLAAAFVRPQAAPITVLGGVFIDRTPTALKNVAVQHFGTSGRTVLLLGMYAAIAVLAVGIGVLAPRTAALGVAALAAFSLVAAFVTITRPGGRVSDVVPAIIGGIAGVAALLWLMQASAPAPPVRHTRGNRRRRP